MATLPFPDRCEPVSFGSVDREAEGWSVRLVSDEGWCRCFLMAGRERLELGADADYLVVHRLEVALAPSGDHASLDVAEEAGGLTFYWAVGPECRPLEPLSLGRERRREWLAALRALAPTP